MWGREVFGAIFSQTSDEEEEDGGEKDDLKWLDWKATGDLREGYDIDTLRRFHEDIQFTMDHQLSVFTELTEKARRLFRFSGLVLTIFVAAGSQGGYEQYLNAQVKWGLLLLLISAVIGLLGQLSQSVAVGPGEQEFYVNEKGKLREHEYIRWIIRTGYLQWIDQARRKSKRKGRFIEIGYVLSIIGLGLVVWGIYLTLEV